MLRQLHPQSSSDNPRATETTLETNHSTAPLVKNEILLFSPHPPQYHPTEEESDSRMAENQERAIRHETAWIEKITGSTPHSMYYYTSSSSMIMETKYYSASLVLRSVHLDLEASIEQSPGDLIESMSSLSVHASPSDLVPRKRWNACDAFLFLLTSGLPPSQVAECRPSLSHQLNVLKAIHAQASSTHLPSILLCVLDHPYAAFDGEQKEEIGAIQTWCIANGWELVDAESEMPSPDAVGVDARAELVGEARVKEALAANMWDGMILKGSEPTNNASTIIGMRYPGEDGYDDDDDEATPNEDAVMCIWRAAVAQSLANQNKHGEEEDEEETEFQRLWSALVDNKSAEE